MLPWPFVRSIMVTNLPRNLTKRFWSNLHIYSSSLVRTAMPPSFTFAATTTTTTLDEHVSLDLSCSHGYNLTMPNLGWFLLTFISLDRVFNRIDLIHKLQPTNVLSLVALHSQQYANNPTTWYHINAPKTLIKNLFYFLEPYLQLKAKPSTFSLIKVLLLYHLVAPT